MNTKAALVNGNIRTSRFKDIGNVERYLARSGTIILKFFLHVVVGPCVQAEPL